jgi:drug/metabolite transporter (DMT)-like permease
MLKFDQKELKGFTYAGIAAIALANSFIFSKLCFRSLDFYQFGFLWFFIGCIWNFSYLVFYKNNESPSDIKWYNKLTSPLIMIAMLESVATGLFYYAILTMENPGVVSFIGNIGPVFVTILGLIILKETFSKTQFLGIVIAVFGIFILNYKDYKSLSEILIPGSQYVIFASFLFSVAAIIARNNYSRIDTGILSMFRALILLFSFTFLVFGFSEFKIPGLITTIYIAAGSFLEVFITIVFAYLSFRYIKAFKTSITISTKGIFALLSAWLFLDLQPTTYQIIGGVLSLVGVILVSKEKKKNTRP